MAIRKTRCKECYHKEIDAIQMPCSKCSEIQIKRKNQNNYFTPLKQNINTKKQV